MNEKFILAVMNEDGINTELLQYFETFEEAEKELKTIKDRDAYVWEILASKHYPRNSRLRATSRSISKRNDEP